MQKNLSGLRIIFLQGHVTIATKNSALLFLKYIKIENLYLKLYIYFTMSA